MRRVSLVSLGGAAVVLSCCCGCLLVNHSTRVVRQYEKPRSAQFESAQAQNLFEAGVVDMKSHKESSNPQVVAIPFVIWLSRMDELSDTAVYNDQLLVCDSNGDGLITTEEAFAFRAMAKSKASEKKSGDDSNLSQIASKIPPGTSGDSGPHGLIEWKSQELQPAVQVSQNAPLPSGGTVR